MNNIIQMNPRQLSQNSRQRPFYLQKAAMNAADANFYPGAQRNDPGITSNLPSG